MLLQNLRAQVGARLNGDREAGFTLIELLVVMLILGILAAIALPAFFNQRDKAGDAKAKEYAHSAQVAMETYATENGGSYVGAEVGSGKNLNKIEPTLNSAELSLGTLSSTGYEIKSKSSTGNSFNIKNEAGTLKFECTTEKTGGCPSGGKWDKG